MGNNKGKRKALTQRHVCSRMNFLYQAANLMAHSNNNTLAAHYGKLCRNVGTKALMHMSPALKRTLCKRCSLPLLPGVNTMLKMAQQPQEPPQQQLQQQQNSITLTATESKSSKRRRRLRGKRRSSQKASAAADHKEAASATSMDEYAQLQLECILCRAQRRFRVDTRNECWPERAEAIVQVLTLDKQTDADVVGQGGGAEEQ